MLGIRRFGAVLSFLVFVTLSCGQEGGDTSGQAGPDFASLSDAAKAGREIYVAQAQNCALCHGDVGQGKPKMGPSLTNLGESWTRDQLADYILDPEGYLQKHDNFQSNADAYTLPMKAYPGLDKEKRLQLADYLLSLK